MNIYRKIKIRFFQKKFLLNIKEKLKNGCDRIQYTAQA